MGLTPSDLGRLRPVPGPGDGAFSSARSSCRARSALSVPVRRRSAALLQATAQLVVLVLQSLDLTLRSGLCSDAVQSL
jgi:hypothetical protein